MYCLLAAHDEPTTQATPTQTDQLSLWFLQSVLTKDCPTSEIQAAGTKSVRFVHDISPFIREQNNLRGVGTKSVFDHP